MDNRLTGGTVPDAQHGAAPQPDEELMKAFQAGREEAFVVLVGRYKHQLMNFAYCYLGDYDESDDVVQEAFIRVFRHRHAYKPIAKFSTWLYTITVNLAKTELRRRKRHAFFSLSWSRGGAEEGRDAEIPDERYAPDREAERSVTRALIQRALAAISPNYREVVVLCDIQELSYEEICAITGLKIGTVKSRLNRGRAKLQILLRGVADEEENVRPHV